MHKEQDRTIIRMANLNDAPQLLPLIGQLGYGQNLNQFEGNFKTCLTSSIYHCLVIESLPEQVIIGCSMAIIYPRFYKPSNHCVLEVIVVDDKYKKRGLGTKLLKATELLAKKHNCSSISLISNKKREEEIHNFYRHNGYHNQGHTAQLYLRKELIPSAHSNCTNGI